jgi:hypothetical protein
MSNNRITINDTLMDALVKMSEGNPGAITVLSRLVKEGGKIDKLSFFGGLTHILLLDEYEIYGSKIWMLFKDVCKQNIEDMIYIIRSVQLGLTSKENLHIAINSYGTGLNVEEIHSKVKDRLKSNSDEPLKDQRGTW